jgi:hypothetical protein
VVVLSHWLWFLHPRRLWLLPFNILP